MNGKGVKIDDVLSIIAEKRPTGVLTLETEIHLGTLTFKDGLLINAQSPYGLKLGDIILAQGKIDAELLLKTVEKQKQDGNKEPLGSIFIKMGKITFEEVKEIVAFQMEDALKTFRKWSDISFSFFSKDITYFDSIYLEPERYLKGM
ncbi:MAG: DUF4388 domain-containing protein [Nitrospirae bacterium]|nr:DUF4388 domain-containing protein [Nitrospirota bacterium]